ncbi:hypothetical protein [Candidatus Phytoplasma palmae]|uniref:hypothetical protein n=1 Tax=Candidatus Phytoplasma palmae TaxID=85624 RepID=UPI003990B778
MVIIEFFSKLFHFIFDFVKEQYQNILQFKNIDFSNTTNFLPSLGSLSICVFALVKIIFFIIVIYFIKDILRIVFNSLYYVFYIIQKVFKIISFPFYCITQLLRKERKEILKLVNKVIIKIIIIIFDLLFFKRSYFVK